MTILGLYNASFALSFIPSAPQHNKVHGVFSGSNPKVSPVASNATSTARMMSTHHSDFEDLNACTFACSFSFLFLPLCYCCTVYHPPIDPRSIEDICLHLFRLQELLFLFSIVTSSSSSAFFFRGSFLFRHLPHAAGVPSTLLTAFSRAGLWSPTVLLSPSFFSLPISTPSATATSLLSFG